MLNCAHLDQQRQGTAPSRSSFTRYAIYYTPQPGTALAAFGRSWFGRANDGATLQAFSDAGLSGTSFAKLAVTPGRYTGLHALFRAPFAPRDGIGPDAVARREGGPEERMQAGITAGRDSELCEARAGQACIGKGLQGCAVIGTAEPRASECRKRSTGLRRVVDRITGEARPGRSGALPLLVEMGTIKHRNLPRRSR